MDACDESIDAEGLGMRPLNVRSATRGLLSCVVAATRMLARRDIRQPIERVGAILTFADGSHGRIYRETVVKGRSAEHPVLLVVGFRLRWVRGRGHAMFRAESLLNTPLFIGFPGFVSKLWLTADENGLYRGVYQWDGATLADAYVRSLWWVLALVSERESIRYAVVPGMLRDDVLANPAVLECSADREQSWWQIVAGAREGRPPISAASGRSPLCAPRRTTTSRRRSTKAWSTAPLRTPASG